MFGIGIIEILSLLIVVYFAICIGKISSKLGRNGILFGCLSLIPLINLFIFGFLAFTESRKTDQSKQ